MIYEAVSSNSDHGALPYPTIVKADGAWLQATDNEKYMDCTSGSGAVSLGHGHPAVVDAIKAQMDVLVHTGCKLQSKIRQEFFEALCCTTPFPNPRSIPAVTGSEAVEVALKIARASTGRSGLIAFNHSFHGKTSGALDVTWSNELRQYASAANSSSRARFFPYPAFDGTAAGSNSGEVLTQIRSYVDSLAADQRPAAMIVEPLQVTEGVYSADSSFLEGLKSISKEYGVLIIFDEIYTGLGRCGRMYYFENLDFHPDILIVGKSLGNGFPISAVVAEAEIINQLPSGHQTSTYSGHPLGCAAGLAVIEQISKMDAPALAQVLGDTIRTGLNTISSDRISDIRGEGALVGFDIVDGKGLADPKGAMAFARLALSESLLLFFGGANGSTIKLVPPITLTEQETSWLMEKLLRVSRGIAK